MKPKTFRALLRKTVKFDPLEVPNYGLQEAIRYLHIPHATLHYWLRPSIGLVQPAGRSSLSFKNLVECFVLEGLREIHGVRLPAIRKATDYLKSEFDFSHPLADCELKTDGRWIFFWHKGEYLNASLRGQVGIGPILDSYLRRIERDFQTRTWVLYPFMRLEQMRSQEDKPKVVSINTDVCSGKPVLNGSRITTATLASRYLGGDKIPALARSYGRPEWEIADAISWETGQVQAA